MRPTLAAGPPRRKQPREQKRLPQFVVWSF
jgi:hypothetical protein